MLGEFCRACWWIGLGLVVADGGCGGGSVLYLCTYAQDLGELVLAG